MLGLFHGKMTAQEVVCNRLRKRDRGSRKIRLYQHDQSIGDVTIFIAAVTGMCRLGVFVVTLGVLLMSTGTVKWFNPTKGYGFIQPQGGGQDVFVHISAVERAGLSTLNEGQQVEFEIVSNRGKSSAENLKVK
jgi:CspA family cold shock protein